MEAESEGGIVSTIFKIQQIFGYSGIVIDTDQFKQSKAGG
jgi:hypothetical protein